MGEVKLIHNHYLEPRDASVGEISPIGNSKVGDFIGFTYNEKHSSELGIVRTSDGSRFNENLLPTMQDKTVQVPGADGTYYFGSYYTQRQFNVSFAFDDLTEFQVAQLKSHFGDKEIHDLIFDECPYKVYRAKVTGTATIKYIAFSEGATNRLYKGEGSVQFTCYNPFARAKFKSISQIDPAVKGVEEWIEASRLPDTAAKPEWNGNNPTTSSSIELEIINFGDKEADWEMYIKFTNDGGDIVPYIPSFKIENGGKNFLEFKNGIFAKNIGETKEWDSKIKITSKTNLIEGYNGDKKTGNLYNEYLTDGRFFNFSLGTSSFKIENLNSKSHKIGDLVDPDNLVDYKILYF